MHNLKSLGLKTYNSKKPVIQKWAIHLNIQTKDNFFSIIILILCIINDYLWVNGFTYRETNLTLTSLQLYAKGTDGERKGMTKKE